MDPAADATALSFPVDKQRSREDVPDVEVTGALAKPQALTPAEGKQLAKVDQLLSLGDVSGARLMLEHALPSGNPMVAFRLAETYDPKRLSEWRVLGVRGDPAKARELYRQAQAGGVQQARERLAHLP